MQFIDLRKQYKHLQLSIDTRIRNVLEHGQYIMGPEIEELELKLAKWVGTKYCLAVDSGTLALQLALMALDIGDGDEVITSPFSFFASTSTILQLGAKPVFVDIDPRTYNLNPQLIEAAITSRTKAIVAVNLYGQCADYDEINAIAKRHGLEVIEDAAQSFGATYKGRPSGGLGKIGCTSFFPSKPLGCYGDGGACFTSDETLAEKIRLLRNHGQQSRYHHVLLGTNARLDTLQAAILLTKLEVFPEEIVKRQQLAQYYNQLLNKHWITPHIKDYNLSVYAQYTLSVEKRELVQTILRKQGIPTAVHYPQPIYQQPVLNQMLNLPVVEQASKQVLSLPFGPYMSEQEIEYVVNALSLHLTECSV